MDLEQGQAVVEGIPLEGRGAHAGLRLASITGGKISDTNYDLRFAGQHMSFIKSHRGRMEMWDRVLGLEVGTVRCKEGLLNLIPSMVDWKDGRRLFLSRPCSQGSPG